MGFENHSETLTACSTGAVVVAVYLLKLFLFSRDKKSPTLPELGQPLREREFLCDKGSVFCNSGSSSCVPRRLIDRQIQLIKERERDPLKWNHTISPPLFQESIAEVAQLVGAKVENLTLIDNATTATNVIFKMRKYSPGDQILLVNLHSYPAVWKQAKAVVRDNPEVEIVSIDIPFPIRNKDDVIDRYAKALKDNPGIRITVIDHITSSTAVLMPLKELIDLCHQHDVIVAVDGAHTPGQLHLNVEDYQADFYVGNLCKWLMTPKGVAFLWVHPKHQSTMYPLVTSHNDFEEHFKDRFYSTMTRDLIPHIVVKEAIKFHKELGGIDVIVSRNSELAAKAVEMFSSAWHTPELELAPELRAPSMRIIAYPLEMNEIYQYTVSGFCRELEKDLCKEGVSIKSHFFDGRIWCRISCNVWNDVDDLEKVRDVILKFVREKEERIKQRSETQEM